MTARQIDGQTDRTWQMGGQLVATSALVCSSAVCIIIINECHVKIFLCSRTALNQFTVTPQSFLSPFPSLSISLLFPSSSCLVVVCLKTSTRLFYDNWHDLTSLNQLYPVSRSSLPFHFHSFHSVSFLLRIKSLDFIGCFYSYECTRF